MDRDAPPPAPDPLPPVSWETVRAAGRVGIGLTAAAAALGLVATAIPEPPGVLAAARLLLVLAGTTAAGFGVSLRPGLWKGWAYAAAAGLLAVVGVPASWDSFRLLFAALTGVAAVGAVLAAAPPRWRYGAISALVVFHFGGIFMAAASPAPATWFVDQMFQRVYNPYLQFLYMRNAYHFYSPEPGPASLLAFLVTTYKPEKVGADGRPELDANGRPVRLTLPQIAALPPDERQRQVESAEWVVLPRRPADVRDPLGLTYYRRLSLTEQLARVYPGLISGSEQFEKSGVKQRRTAVQTEYPLLPTEDVAYQYRLPNPDIALHLLPSYTSHVILDRTDDPAAQLRTTVRTYRIEHRTMDVTTFTGVMKPPAGNDPPPTDPYHPTTYRPYYLGEYDVYGALLYPQDPMLNWLVPVLPQRAGPDRPDYYDVLSKQAGAGFNWRQLR